MRVLFIITLLVFLEACASAGKHPVAGASQEQSGEFERYCMRLQEAYSQGDAQFIREGFDVNGFLDNAFFGLRSSAPQFADFRKSLYSTQKDYASTLVDMASTGVPWTVVRFRESPGEARCMLRSGFGDSGFYLVEFYLHEKNGEITVNNWFDYVKGQLMSDSLRVVSREVLRAYGNEARHGEGDPAEFNQLMQFMRLANNGDYEGAIQTYRQLPDHFQENPVYAFKQIEVSSYVSMDALKQAMDDFARRFGDREEFSVFLFDYYVENGELEKARGAIDYLGKKIDSDPVIHLLSAFISQQQGNDKQFYRDCLAAIEADASYEQTYWILVDDFVTRKNYEMLVYIFDLLDKGFGYTFARGTFASDPYYAGFVASAEFDQWMKDMSQ